MARTTEFDDPTLSALADEGAGAGLPVRPERSYWIASTILLVVFLAFWQYATKSGLIHQIILPAPSDIAQDAPELLTDPDFVPHVATTTVEVVGGFLFGSLVGLALGIALALSPLLRRAYFPLVAAFQATPRVILAPVVVAWFGFGIQSKIVQAMILCFFP